MGSPVTRPGAWQPAGPGRAGSRPRAAGTGAGTRAGPVQEQADGRRALAPAELACPLAAPHRGAAAIRRQDCQGLRVVTVEHDQAGDHSDRRVHAEHPEPGPGGEQVRGRLRRPDLAASVERQPLVDVHTPRLGQEVRQDEQHEQQADGGRDRPCGMAESGADPEREQPAGRQEQAAADDGPQHVRLRQCRVDVLARQQRLPDEERGEARDPADGQRDSGEHDRLGGVDHTAARHRGQRGADHAGRVLGGDRQRAQHHDHQLAQDDTGQARRGCVEGQPVARGCLVPVRGRPPAEQRAEADGDHDHREQRPVRGPDRTDLGELRAQRGCEAHPAMRCGKRGRPGGLRGCRRHVSPCSRCRPATAPPPVRRRAFPRGTRRCRR